MLADTKCTDRDATFATVASLSTGVEKHLVLGLLAMWRSDAVGVFFFACVWTI